MYRLPELAFTIYADYYREHHFLFQVLYMPFALIHDPYLGAKLAASFYAILAGCVFAFILYESNVSYVAFWVLLFLVSSQGFLLRILMPRVQSVSLIFLLLFVYFLLKGKKWPLLLVSFAYVWLYDAFFLLIPITVLYLIAVFFTERKFSWDLVPFIIGGLFLGLVINPYFPQNIRSYTFNITRSLFTTKGVTVGIEWQPYPLVYYVQSNLFSLVLLAMGLFVLVTNRTGKLWSFKQLTHQVFFGLLAVMFLFLSLKSRRFIEYMPPFVLLFCASMTTHLIAEGRQKFQKTGPFILLCAGILGAVNVHGVYAEVRSTPARLCYKKASQWAKRHIPAGETLYTTDWDDFPPLYIQAQHIIYIVGLDPLFMAEKNGDMYRQWVDLTQARGESSLARRIWDLFQARYVFADTDHVPFMKRLEAENEIHRLFSCETSRIYKIKDHFTSSTPSF